MTTLLSFRMRWIQLLINKIHTSDDEKLCFPEKTKSIILQKSGTPWHSRCQRPCFYKTSILDVWQGFEWRYLLKSGFKIILNVLSLVDQAKGALQNLKNLFSKKKNELKKANKSGNSREAVEKANKVSKLWNSSLGLTSIYN